MENLFTTLFENFSHHYFEFFVIEFFFLREKVFKKSVFNSTWKFLN